MNAIRNRVSEKLSRLFSDSPSSHETVDQEPEVRPNAKDGKSLTSMLSFVIPSTSLEWFRPNMPNNDAKLSESDSFRWRSKSFSLKDKPLEMNTESENISDAEENIAALARDGQHGFDTDLANVEPDSSRSTGSRFDVFEDAVTHHSLEDPMPLLMDESIFISPDLYQFFESCLPNIVKGCQWVLLYSTARDGISLRTLIRKTADISGPCLLITGDKQGAVFGGLLACPLQPTAKRKYQGTNQCFVFTTIYGEPRLFRPTGANRYFYMCLNDLIALGGGGQFALCLNEDLLSGTSGPCETFGNMCLAHEEEFSLKNVELWGFTHASQYIIS